MTEHSTYPLAPKDRRTAFALLGLPMDASPKDIRAAWRALARTYHPDQFNNNRVWANARLAQLNAAYDLTNTEHDQTTKAARNSAPCPRNPVIATPAKERRAHSANVWSHRCRRATSSPTGTPDRRSTQAGARQARHMLAMKTPLTIAIKREAAFTSKEQNASTHRLNTDARQAFEAALRMINTPVSTPTRLRYL